jgi:hypothetical protein
MCQGVKIKIILETINKNNKLRKNISLTFNNILLKPIHYILVQKL